MITFRPIHPFPARMAPEIALRACERLAPRSIVLDPMAGSGTVLRVSATLGHRAIGMDLDPLAVLMSRVWLTPVDVDGITRAARELVARARMTGKTGAALPWIDGDRNTEAFVNFWFAPRQRDELRAIAGPLAEHAGATADVLRLALSRIIVTKDRGASLARDTAHSRPHRWYEPSDYDVFAHFEMSVRRLVSLLAAEPHLAQDADVRLGDAREIGYVAGDSIDLVITSPPYLNAIDYMRGHRLALVWLGHQLADLRSRRSRSIGTERGLRSVDSDAAGIVQSYAGQGLNMSSRNGGILTRFSADLAGVVGEIRRVLRPDGRAVLVVGNSFLDRVPVDNAKAVVTAARLRGLELVSTWERVLPDRRRYLPPPGGSNRFRSRMRTETVLEFAKP